MNQLGTQSPKTPKFDLWRASAMVVIAFVLIVIVCESWKRIQFENMSPIGQALSERDPELFQRELQEHRDAAKAQPNEAP